MSRVCETGATLKNVARAYGPHYHVGIPATETPNAADRRGAKVNDILIAQYLEALRKGVTLSS
jgi:hypothetical protein